jgi:hypothetical protein
MIKEVKYNGYSASPSDYESIDGDLAAVVNMIPEDGALHPIAPPKVVFSLGAGQKVVLLHETSSYSHYIVQDASNKLYWRTEGNSTLHSIHSFGSTKINYITSIGNTIVALCEDGMHYMLWEADNNAYTYLGNKIPECPISFGLKCDPKRYSLLTDGETAYGKFDISYDSLDSTDNGSKFSEENKSKITAQVLSKVNKFIAEVGNGDNKFIYPFFVRYAYRLYDNTLTHHSAPILMIPSSAANPIVHGTIGSSSAELDVFTVAATLDYKPLISTTDKSQLSKWKDIVKSVEIFISAPIYTYDQSGECEGLSVFPRWRFYGKYNSPKTDWEAENMNRYYQLQNIYNCFAFDYTTFEMGQCITLPTYTEAEINAKVKDCSAFYFLTSIDIADLPTERVNVPFDEGILDSLVAREVMTDDYQSHDILIPKFAQAYNARLNIANIERSLFKGYDPSSMVCYQNSYLDYTSLDTPTNAMGTYYWDAYTKHVADKTLTLKSSSADTLVGAPWAFLYLYYPDTAAKSITMYNGNSGQGKHFKLEPHNRLNGAVYFAGFNSGGFDDMSQFEATADAEARVSVPNKIYTSEVNNPFSFPLLGINTIGTGEIIGISTAAKALSEGQFGQFPLYAFTTDGVWALEVSATGSYSAKQPITRDVCLNGESITQIDDAVLFATARGIMLISGSESICITDILDAEQPFLISQLPSAQKFVESVASLSMNNVNYLPFQTFLAGCRMIYDYIKQRIFVFNPSCRYAYVYSLESKAWGIVASNITSSINSYPEPLAMTRDNKMVNMSLSEYTTGIPCLLVTRPLSLDARDTLKTIETIIQRGFFKKGDVKVALYGSRDLHSWFMIYSSTDHYLRGFRGTPYKFYRIAVSASLDLPDTISGCTTQFELRQINQPR